MRNQFVRDHLLPVARPPAFLAGIGDDHDHLVEQALRRALIKELIDLVAAIRGVVAVELMEQIDRRITAVGSLIALRLVNQVLVFDRAALAEAN